MRDRSRRSTVGLIGGLGNQLFQFSFGLWLQQSGQIVSFDASALRSGSRQNELTGLVGESWLPQEKWLKIMPYPRGRLGKIGEIVRMAFGPRQIRYEDLDGVPETPECAPAAWWYGYWQCPERVRATLPDLRKAMADVLPSIQCSTVGIHVRRGDYTGNAMLLSPDYYRRALNSLLAARGLQESSIRIIVYSDDPEWCAAEMNFDVAVTYAPRAKTKQDFIALMSCEYLILSRSTFSWWSAVLPNRPDGHVLAPFPFVPASTGYLDYDGWLRMDVN